MGRRGPPPKPTILKLLAGNPGKRAVNRREPKMQGGPVRPPSWLGKAARSEWARVMKVCPPGLLTQADRNTLAQYCQTYARLVEVERMIDEQGYTFVAESGYAGVRPEVSVAEKLHHRLNQLAKEMGLTPAARSRVEMPEPPKADKTEDFLFGQRRGA